MQIALVKYKPTIKDEVIELDLSAAAHREAVGNKYVSFAGGVYKQTEIGSGVFMSIHPHPVEAT